MCWFADWVISYAISLSPSVRMKEQGSHWTRIFMKFDTLKPLEICPENSSFLKIWQELILMNMKIYARLW